MMNAKFLNVWNLVWLLLAVVATGCGGGGPDRYGVSGTVTFKGQNLEKGQIVFSPAQIGSGTQGGAEIVNGAFKIDAKQGLPEGKYKVTISSPEGGSTGSGDLPGDPAESKPATEKIPAKYNAKTELTRDVTAGGPNTFDFKLD